MRVTSSKSVLLLAVVLGLSTLVGGATAAPGLLRATQDVVDVQPQLLRTDPSVTGRVRLTQQLSVSLFASGLQVRRDGVVILETVRIGSVLSAGTGHVAGDADDREETVAHTLDSWHVTALRVSGTTVTYTGPLVGNGRSASAALSVMPSGDGVRVTASVPGMQLVVLHLDRPQAPRGVPPVLPDRSLTGRAWWLPRAHGQGADQPRTAWTSAVRGTRTTTSVRVDADVLLDNRHQGRAEIHVWAPVLRLVVR